MPLQWLALREGFIPLHRLLLHVTETDSLYATQGCGDVLVDGGRTEGLSGHAGEAAQAWTVIAVS